MPLELMQSTQPQPPVFLPPEDPASVTSSSQPQQLLVPWPGQLRGVPVQPMPAMPRGFAAGGGGVMMPAASAQQAQPHASHADALEELEAAGRDKLARSIEKTRQAA